MEMNFPHRHHANLTTLARTDFRALLASAISRQGNSFTVREMTISQAKKIATPETVACSLQERIDYFSSDVDRKQNSCAAFGAFSVDLAANSYAVHNYDHGVYQYASMKRKDQMINTDLSVDTAGFAGQENRGMT